MQYLDARERICRSHRWPNDGCQPRSDRDVSGPKKAALLQPLRANRLPGRWAVRSRRSGAL